MMNIIAKFANEINLAKDNGEILATYNKFLTLYANTNFKDYTFIVGTNDSIGVQQNGYIKQLIKKQYHYKDKQNIFTMDLLNSYKYFFILTSNFKEHFGLDISLFVDTNMAGFFANFIKNNGRESHELAKQIAENPYINLFFLFYVFENIHNPNRKKTHSKADEILDNLCKFNSLYRDKYIHNKTLKINEQYYMQMRDFLRNNFDEKILAKYNFIYAYLIYAFVEKNSPNFDIKQSIRNILQIMQENGTNYAELLEFIYSYLKNGNNAFFNVVKTQSYEKIKENIKNMSWDIFFSYSIKYHLIYFTEKANFGFPIFATMDKKFFENYAAALFDNKMLVFKDNKFEFCIRKPNQNTQEIQEFCGDIGDNFQRDKLKDETSKYIISQRALKNAEICLKSFLSNGVKK